MLKVTAMEKATYLLVKQTMYPGFTITTEDFRSPFNNWNYKSTYLGVYVLAHSMYRGEFLC